jgi:putative LysE/RhtB family amino acid efflux pump
MRTAVTDHDLPQPKGWLHSCASAFLFGLSNPLTILLFVAAIPALTVSGDLEAVPVLVTGVFLGSITWWAILSTTTALIRDRLSASAIALTNKASGLTLAALGTLMLVKTFRQTVQ